MRQQLPKICVLKSKTSLSNTRLSKKGKNKLSGKVKELLEKGGSDTDDEEKQIPRRPKRTQEDRHTPFLNSKNN